jgi:hypothetical protein
MKGEIFTEVIDRESLKLIPGLIFTSLRTPTYFNPRAHTGRDFKIILTHLGGDKINILLCWCN